MSQASEQANIVRLYEELGVRPEDGVERLTERYRQRLRQLHPDARESGPQRSVDEPGAEDGLGWLTRSYREAVGFARSHGRLPGAGAPGAARPATDEPAPATTVAAAAEAAPVGRFEASPATVRRGGRSAAPPRRLGWRWLVGASAIVAVTLVTMPELLEPPALTPFNRDLGIAPAGRGDAAAAAGGIRIGSSMADVLRIQGAPTRRGDGVWEYGPSFVRFEDGVVRDWHSSPLQPLRVEHVGR
jgi:hypothetical protein